MATKKCRRCEASVEWAVFHRSEKDVPLELGLVRDGNLTVVGYRDGEVPVVRILNRDELELARSNGLPTRRAHEHWER